MFKCLSFSLSLGEPQTRGSLVSAGSLRGQKCFHASFSWRFFASFFFPIWSPFGCQNGPFWGLFGCWVSLSVLNFDFWSFNFFFLHSRPFTEMRNVFFSLGFPSIFAYGPSVFVFLFWPFFLIQSVRFGTPKRSKIDPQIASKSRPDFDTAKGPNLLRFGCPLGSPKSPQNRFSDPVGAPGRFKIASWCL